MLARTPCRRQTLCRNFVPAGLVAFSLLVAGCKNQTTNATQSGSAAIQNPSPQPTPGPLAPQAPIQSAQAPAAQPDDASMLAKRTADYARQMSPMLSPSANPASRPSLVDWVDPAKHSPESVSTASPANATDAVSQAPLANQPATLAVAHLKEDTSVPLILPESADQIQPAPTNPSATPVTASTDDYEQKLHKLVQEYPRDLGYQLDYQVLRLVRDEPTPDMNDVSQLSNEDRDLLLALMDGLNNFRNAARGNNNIMLNSKIQPLIEMTERLRSQAQLSIPAVAFCSRVSGYGVYTPLESSRFPAGQEAQMILYNEAANFTSVQGSDSVWRTRLRQEMVLYTDSGLAVWPDKSNAATFVDQSRNRRHDFFISRRVTLPASLASGKYVLKVTLTDEQSNRVVEASAPLELAGPAIQPGAEQAADHATPSLMGP
jgi:hypothetical protein